MAPQDVYGNVRVTAMAVTVLVLAMAACEASASPFAIPHSPYKYMYSSLASVDASPFTWQTLSMTQFLDHFSERNSTATFQQRYLVNDTFWNKPDGPILFYSGNEAPIELFAANTGLMWELAPKLGALLVFGEHRYFGHSKPFDGASFKNVRDGKLAWLSVDQALADYAALIPHVRSQFGASNKAAVITLGGSYGGLLSAWFRIKYPFVVDGAIASSAPILAFPGLSSSETFSESLTNTFATAGPGCADGIHASWDALVRASVDTLNAVFKPCTPFTSTDEAAPMLFTWLAEAYAFLAMADYPYPASMLGPLPGHPVNLTCTFFDGATTDQQLLGAMRNAGNLFYNYTGQAGSCHAVSQPGPKDLQDPGAFAYLSCSELIMPQGCEGEPNDMFIYKPWNLTQVMEACQAKYGVVPRPHWIVRQYGGGQLHYSSNIVFSNGNLDPWMSGGILKSVSSSVQAVVIYQGAHHFDLRASNPADPQSVIDARNLELQQIQAWAAARMQWA